MTESCAPEKARRQGGYVLAYRPMDRSRWRPCTNSWHGHEVHGVDQITEPYWIQKWGTDQMHWVMYLGPCRAGRLTARCEYPLRPDRWAADEVYPCS